MSSGAELAGRVALVTGASRGIGYAIAQALRQDGAAVILAARDETAVKEAAARLGPETLPLSADVRANDSALALVDSAHSWRGRLDIVVNCAGPPLTSAPLADTDDTLVDSALDLKLRGFIRVAKAALPMITDDGTGTIVNIAGATAHTLIPGTALTGIVNAAVVAMTSYLASEAAPRNVRVNAVSPGMTLTERWRDRHETMARQQNRTADEIRAGMVSALGIRLGRWAHPREIASTVAFLASDRASYITSQVLRVDGGLTRQVM